MGNASDVLRGNDAIDVQWYFQAAARELGFTSKSFVDGGGGTRDARCTLKPDRQIFAATKERRIRAAMIRLPARTYRILALAYSSPGYLNDKEIGEKLGRYPALAVAESKLIQDGFRTYQRKFKPRQGKNGVVPSSLELWIIRNVVKSRSDVAKKVRDNAEAALTEALLAYIEVRRPKTKGERDADRRLGEQQRQRRLPRRSVAEDVAGVGYGR